MRNCDVGESTKRELTIQCPHFILFVRDQERSTEFYRDVLGLEPRLHVPGMTEFELPGGAVLGLMPERGIRRLLDLPQSEPECCQSDLKAECYLIVNNPEAFLKKAIHAGAVLLSPVQKREWGHTAGYCRDLDGTILAFASPVTST